MSRPLPRTHQKVVGHDDDHSRVLVLDSADVVQVALLAGAGHTAWVNEWPSAIRTECEEIIGRLLPRCSVEIYVPNLDHAGTPIDAQHYADELRAEITRVTGGQTSFRTEGDFRPAGTVGLVENTIVLKTFLPTVVNDALRLWLVDLLVGFGLSAAQDVVQVEIASHGYWIHTELLRGRVGDAGNGSHPDQPTRRVRRLCSIGS